MAHAASDMLVATITR